MQGTSDAVSSSAATTRPQDAAPQPTQPATAATERPSPNFVHTDEINLKRTYLRLLPAVQIVEICLSFDAYVPVEVKNRVWPIDFHSAIAALQLEASVLPKLPGSSHDPLYGHALPAKGAPALFVNPAMAHAAPSTVPPNDEPPMGSLQDPAKIPAKSNTQTAQISSPPTSLNPSASRPPPEGQPVAGPSKPSTSTLNEEPNTSANAYTPPSYPHIPYSYHPHLYAQPSYYGHPPGAYPHYPGYPTAYPHYPQYPSNGQTPPVPSYPTPPPMRPPIQVDPAGMSAEDLPSYEDMIVEALMDCADPEGLAPKNMFQWMAARYPLQSNFRPSASQALQKAFKRGRLEKSNDGKYRLNASWEGGSVSTCAGISQFTSVYVL
ncbi:hypothetical protein OE88DRAFT_1405925 [Heliocybe sulcata]|uniref:Histone H1 n=1 Tax=Heliocybe sulcata TaxID=5364 RepID=A0A5C3NG04_9AGAM|nr:hypothetical protein OE88DRAFT_1405925 [Heliocybe sulcata]